MIVEMYLRGTRNLGLKLFFLTNSSAILGKVYFH